MSTISLPSSVAFPIASSSSSHQLPPLHRHRGHYYQRKCGLDMRWVRCLPRQSKTTILIYICIASLIVLKLACRNNATTNYNASHRRQLKQSNQATSIEGGKDDDDDREFMYIIIHYHKTGHDLTRSLIDMISSGLPGISKPVVWPRRTMLRTFLSETKVSTC